MADYNEHNKETDHHSHHVHKHNVNQHGHKVESEPKPAFEKTKKSGNLFLWQAISAILAILLIGAFFFGMNKSSDATDALPAEEATKKAIDFINENVLTEGQTAEMVDVVEENGLYKVKLSIEGQEFESYLSKDGKILFPSALDMTVGAAEPDDSSSSESSKSGVPKSEKPTVELFVMSYCPYGTQTEKGFIPVVKLLGDKIDWDIKFVYYAMHGKTELDEQLLQHCIKTEQSDKFIPYLECFLGEGNTESCLTEVDIDNDMLEACIASTDEEYQVTELYNDQSTWLSGRYPLFNVNLEDNQKYSVGGSPSLIINGVSVSSSRDSQNILDLICSSFENPPEECSTELSSATPAPGFGYQATGTATSATCG